MYCNTLLTVIYKYTLQYNYSQYMSQLQPVTHFPLPKNDVKYEKGGKKMKCGKTKS